MKYPSRIYSQVRALQELLGEYGYYCGEEDMHFWCEGGEALSLFP